MPSPLRPMPRAARFIAGRVDPAGPTFAQFSNEVRQGGIKGTPSVNKAQLARALGGEDR